MERPSWHFAPERNWMNDPNGLVFFKRRFHLFYQYNPFGDVWGHMSWGHAVSEDLLTWREKGVAIPEEEEYMIFSGSAVVDEKNSSGLGDGGEPPLVAIYTAHKEGNQSQHLAYSLDEGETWKQFEGNPVLDIGLSDFRDPKVFRYENRWIMAVALPKQSKIAFFSSEDLKNWDHLSEFGPAGAHGLWECPDLFFLDGSWVLLVSLNPGGIAGGSGTQYFVGDFDGTSFRPHHENTLWLDHGPDNYAAVTFNELEERVAIGWMSNWDYAHDLAAKPWRGSMTIPRKLSLSNGLLHSKPVGKSTVVRLEPRGEQYGLDFIYEGERRLLLRVDRSSREIWVDRSEVWSLERSTRHSARMDDDSELFLEIVTDEGSVEIFAGPLAFTVLVTAEGQPRLVAANASLTYCPSM